MSIIHCNYIQKQKIDLGGICVGGGRVAVHQLTSKHHIAALGAHPLAATTVLVVGGGAGLVGVGAHGWVEEGEQGRGVRVDVHRRV